MIPIENYAAEFRCGNQWHPCRVVGVTGEVNDLQFVVIVRGPVEYVDTVAEIRRPPPVNEPL